MERKYWYKFTGSVGSEWLVGSYNQVPNANFCTSGPAICAVYALYGGDNHPLSLSQHITDYIAQAKIDSLSQPRTGEPFIVRVWPG